MKILGLYKGEPKRESGDNALDFYRYLNNSGIEFYVSKISEFDMVRNSFRSGYLFNGNRWVNCENIIPDVVYDKSCFFIDKENRDKRNFISKIFPFKNNLDFTEILSSKWKTYQFISEFCPKTVLIKNNKDFSKLKIFNSEKIIFKPDGGSKGIGIIICKRGELPELSGIYVAQELIPVMKGLPGIIAGPHDLRIMIQDGKIFHSFVRIPQEGKLISNLSYGGEVKYVPTEKIPKSVTDICMLIDDRVKKFGSKLYTIDFIIDDFSRPWVLEMNAHPALILEDAELVNREGYYEAIINFLKNV